MSAPREQASLPLVIAECGPMHRAIPVREAWYLILYLTQYGQWTLLGDGRPLIFTDRNCAEREAASYCRHRPWQVISIPGWSPAPDDGSGGVP